MDIPNEIFSMIIAHLNPVDQKKMCLVSSKVGALAMNALWNQPKFNIHSRSARLSATTLNWIRMKPVKKLKLTSSDFKLPAATKKYPDNREKKARAIANVLKKFKIPIELYFDNLLEGITKSTFQMFAPYIIKIRMRGSIVKNSFMWPSYLSKSEIEGKMDGTVRKTLCLQVYIFSMRDFIHSGYCDPQRRCLLLALLLALA